MRRAIALAWGGAGWTNPNPLVGAVLVKGGRVVGEGFHERYGREHAERNALADCARRGESARDATLYVTLEPCCHQGKQPPCTEAVVAAGVSRVVVGSRDPNPLVAGKGNALLREAGVQVDEDVLRGECDELNPVFFHYIQTRRPFVVAKWAMTLDGKIATRTGDSRWVSNEESRADAHELRHRLAAIMVGSGTALADNPSLTARRGGGRESNQPLRVVVDGRLRIPEDSQLVRTTREVPTLVATAVADDDPKARRLRERGVEVLQVALGGCSETRSAGASQAGDPQAGTPPADAPQASAPPAGAPQAGAPGLQRVPGKVDLSQLMDVLGQRGVDSLLVEGGGGLHEALFSAGLVNQVVVYLAPKVVGGADAKSPVEGMGARLMADALQLSDPRVERLGSDLKLTYRVL